MLLVSTSIVLSLEATPKCHKDDAGTYHTAETAPRIEASSTNETQSKNKRDCSSKNNYFSKTTW